MRQISVALLVFMLASGASGASAATILGVSWEGSVVSIDSSSGSSSSVGSSGFSGLNSLARSSTGQLITVAGHPLLTTDSTLVDINPSTGAGTSLGTITGLPAGTIRAAAFSSSDVLFAIANGGGPFSTTEADDLYTINLSSGVPTLIGNTGFAGIQGLAFAPDGTLYGWDVTSDFTGAGLIALNPSTGSGSDVNALVGEAGVDIQALAVASDGTLYGARNTLYLIDSTTGSPSAVGSGGYPDVRGIEVLGRSNGPPPTSPIPEPATWWLLGLGLFVGAGFRAQRR
ncbi:MAG: PEP-CTERM sorting domain-containing protein [Candidatus Omnitrophica bacterium]|nr:PEP-CTERM sorting domain-containing protein [Candidatus Omnitrophota bacterium]